MSMSLVAIAVGGSILAARYFIRRKGAVLAALKPSGAEIPQNPNGVFDKMGGRFSRVNLLGFEAKMSHSEACNILNVSATTSKDKVREAYKQLMMRNHPDNGGSTYIASKVNEAKDLMLK